MYVDKRLGEIDDCLYRVAIRVLVMQNDKVLLIKEAADGWWAIPGGGVDYGETIETTLLREIEEELGVPPSEVVCDYKIIHYNIGQVVNGVPRMNIFYRAFITENSIKDTSEASAINWFTKDDFLEQELHPSYDKTILADVVFN